MLKPPPSELAHARAHRVALLFEAAGIGIDVERDVVAGLLLILLDQAAKAVEPRRGFDDDGKGCRLFRLRCSSIRGPFVGSMMVPFAKTEITLFATGYRVFEARFAAECTGQPPSAVRWRRYRRRRG
jgi:hypothetical protein